MVYLLLLLCLIAPLSADTNWPQWRGPDASGVSSEPNLPLEWSATKNVQWKTPIPGRGQSSPIIWGKRIFLTSSLEGDVLPGAKAATEEDFRTEYLDLILSVKTVAGPDEADFQFR